MGAPDPRPDDEPLRAGVVVGAKYRLVEPSGSGGMGSVWRAEHLSLGHEVAIKFLHGSVARAKESRARFEREARFSAKLGEQSMHVVRVTDHGVTEHGRPFLVMELLKGESLGERLEREGRLPLALVSAITTQLCRALHVAHVAGIVHRDLKPANVFLCRGGPPEADGLLVKLLDFGVAKATLELDAQPVTRAGFIVGTPAYMSPEQITGEKYVDARADLWAVAAIVYRMAVGAPPFGNGQLDELGRRITTEAPLPPSRLASDLPVELDAWIARGLAKRPDDRFQTTGDLAEALVGIARLPPASSAVRSVVRVADDGPTRADAPGGDVATTLPDPIRSSPPRSSRNSMPSAEWRPPRSAAVPIALALLLLVGGVIVAVWALGRPRKASTPKETTTSTEAASTSRPESMVPSSTTTTSASASASAPASASSTAMPSSSSSKAAVHGPRPGATSSAPSAASASSAPIAPSAEPSAKIDESF